MIKRIKQLWEDNDTIEVCYPEQGSPVSVSATTLEKFAELIVAECIGIVENLSPGYKDYRDQIEDAFRRDCVIEIKKRFGVE